MKTYAWEDLRIGLQAELETVITPSMMAGFLAATGDDNPLHVDEAFAVERGFRGRVVYGLLTASFYSTLAGVHLPGKDCLLHGLKIDFAAPVYVGDRLRVRGTVVHRNEAFRQVELACEITNQDSVVVSKARLRAGVSGTLRGPRRGGGSPAT